MCPNPSFLNCISIYFTILNWLVVLKQHLNTNGVDPNCQVRHCLDPFHFSPLSNPTPLRSAHPAISPTELTGRQSLQSKLALIFSKRVPFTGQRHRPVAWVTQSIKLKNPSASDLFRDLVLAVQNVDYLYGIVEIKIWVSAIE